jgi:hypothetical protein
MSDEERNRGRVGWWVQRCFVGGGGKKGVVQDKEGQIEWLLLIYVLSPDDVDFSVHGGGE